VFLVLERADLLRIAVGVADLLQRSAQLVGRHLGRVVADQSFLVGKRHADVVHAVDPLVGLADRRGAERQDIPPIFIRYDACASG
jgi:hypothetical protein